MKVNIEYLDKVFKSQASEISSLIQTTLEYLGRYMPNMSDTTLYNLSGTTTGNVPDKKSVVVSDLSTAKKNTESAKSNIEEKVQAMEFAENQAIALGQSMYLEEGTKFYENSAGGGRQGYVGNQWISEDDNLSVGYIAIYSNGNYVGFISKDGNESFEDAMKRYKEEGKIADGDKITISQGLVKDMGDGTYGDVGWLDQVEYNPSKTKEEREALHIKSTVDKYEKVETAEMKSIDDEYDKKKEIKKTETKKTEDVQDVKSVNMRSDVKAPEDEKKSEDAKVEDVKTVYNDAYVSDYSGNTINHYTVTMDLNGKSISDVKEGDTIKEVHSGFTRSQYVTKVEKDYKNGTYKVYWGGGSNCVISMPEKEIQEYKNVHEGATEYKVDGKTHYIKLEKDRKSYCAGDKIIVDGKECTVVSQVAKRDGRQGMKSTITYVDSNGNQGSYTYRGGTQNINLSSGNSYQ